MIKRIKFDSLEKKYSKLCLKHKKLNNKIERFEKMPQALANSYTKEGIYLKRISGGTSPLTGIIYLKSTRIRKNHCDICNKRRKTTAHHLIPKRTKSINKELSQIRIRICNKCDKLIHPENPFDENKIIEKQKREIIRLKNKINSMALEKIKEFTIELENKRNRMIEYAKNLPKELKDNPKRIHPAIKQTRGRIEELKWVINNIKQKINKSYGTRK